MKHQSVDWWRLLWDLTQRDVSLAETARMLDQNRETIRGYAYGSQPPHWRGELMIELWCEVCGKTRQDVPMCDLVITPRVVDRGMKPRDEALRELEGVWR
jgi:hypothetical protein